MEPAGRDSDRGGPASADPAGSWAGGASSARSGSASRESLAEGHMGKGDLLRERVHGSRPGACPALRTVAAGRTGPRQFDGQRSAEEIWESVGFGRRRGEPCSSSAVGERALRYGRLARVGPGCSGRGSRAAWGPWSRRGDLPRSARIPGVAEAVGGERTFSWLTAHRRLVRDYEASSAHSETMIRWAGNERHHGVSARAHRSCCATGSPTAHPGLGGGTDAWP